MATSNFPIPPTFASPIEEDRNTGKPVFSALWLRWFLDVAQVFSALGANAAGVGHNSTTGLQGGAADEYFHLDGVDYAALAGTRITKGSQTTDDIIVDSGTKGLVMRDNQATPHYWRIRVSNTGVLSATDLGTAVP